MQIEIDSILSKESKVFQEYSLITTSFPTPYPNCEAAAMPGPLGLYKVLF